jgi:hypothetical protein
MTGHNILFYPFHPFHPCEFPILAFLEIDVNSFTLLTDGAAPLALFFDALVITVYSGSFLFE